MSYENDSYVHIRQFIDASTCQQLHAITQRFHHAWLKDNREFYQQRAINSAYLTGRRYLDAADRQTLFSLIGSDALMKAARHIGDWQPAFMNTQLFFNPANVSQANYWHRDSQYHLSLDEQKAALSGPNVMHFRIALADEPGIEIVPGSHKQWDTEHSLDVRLARNGKHVNDVIPQAKTVALNAGDLLIFSANAIHRGLYGMQRQALDILLCDPLPQLLQFANPDCLPDANMLAKVAQPQVFARTLEILRRSQAAQQSQQ